jgi:hypothetical protein
MWMVWIAFGVDGVDSACEADNREDETGTHREAKARAETQRDSGTKDIVTEQVMTAMT